MANPAAKERLSDIRIDAMLLAVITFLNCTTLPFEVLDSVYKSPLASISISAALFFYSRF